MGIRTSDREGEKGLTNLMADHRILLLVRKDGFKNRESVRVLNLSQTVCKLVLQQRTLVLEPYETPRSRV